MSRLKPNWEHLFYMPSFYGITMWSIWLLLYWMRLIQWNTPSGLSILLFALPFFFWMASIVAFSSRYKYYKMLKNNNPNQGRLWSHLKYKHAAYIAAILHAIGFMGIIKYVSDFSSVMGGYTFFIINIMRSPYEIRWQSEITSSIGTQISYIGWIAIALTVLWILQKKLTRWWIIPVLLQFISNQFFIDRTRPVWILFTTILILLPASRYITTTKILKIAIAILAGASVLFVTLGIWIGKVAEEGRYGDTILPTILQNIYVYGTSGFAYFDNIVKVEHEFNYMPDRIVYPLVKTTTMIGLTDPPPSQINQFYEVPFQTNVGTFLEPFYRDGGFVFSIFGMIIYSFIFDGLALWFLNRRNVFADYAWANICFTSFIGFFTPKMASSPVWLFCGLGLAMAFLFSWAHRSDR